MGCPEQEQYKIRCLQLERALQQSEERFQRIFHASSNAMAITTIKEGRFVDVNEADASLGGFKREELIGRTLAERGLLADAEQHTRILEELSKTGKVRNREVLIKTKEGDVLTVLLSLDPIVVNDERCLLGVSVDITAREREANALRESEERYRMLVENSLQGIVIIQDSRVIFCNHRLAEISGYSEEELRSFAPAGTNELIGITEKVLREAPAAKQGPVRYECRGVRKDGSEMWLELSATLIKYNGRPAVQAAFIDITDRKLTSGELQKALEWQKAIFEGSRDAIIISDENSRFMDVNKAACSLTGYSREELLQMSAWDLNRDVDPALLEKMKARVLSGEDILGETEIFTKDGRRVDVEFTHRRVMISGEPYMHSTARDITNRKRLEAQFLQAQKMEAVGSLAGGVAHDFNNLLSVIKGYAELLLEDLPPEDRNRPDLEQIEKAAQQAASLIAQLLAFSRKQILQPEFINLNDTVTETSIMLSRLIGEHIELIAKKAPELHSVYADPGQIRQVIMNLAVNARDAMPHGGQLIIETSNCVLNEHYVKGRPLVKPGPYVMLTVSDNGTGMEAAIQERIFEPFFTTKGKGKGTGLGLSTVYGIVKQSNGFIWVYSEPGKGTSFKIYFPAAVDGEVTKSAAEKEEKEQMDAEGAENVLVVEDDAAVRSLAIRILRDRGYNVLEASNGIEALNVARLTDTSLDLVITDVVMPEMGGKELVSSLESILPAVKVLYISGYTDDAIVHHGILDPGVAFLQKPFTGESLARKVREVLDNGTRRRLADPE